MERVFLTFYLYPLYYPLVFLVPAGSNRVSVFFGTVDTVFLFTISCGMCWTERSYSPCGIFFLFNI